MSAATEVDFDFDDIAGSILRRYGRANRDDAEEAVQLAVERLLKKGKPLTGSYVFMEARTQLRDMLKRAERRNHSLDAFREDDGDQVPVELAIDEVDFDAHLALAEADRHPILAERLRAASAGASPVITPRGTRNHASRYTDEQVAEVRRLRERGLKFADIEAQTGVERSYCAGICRGKHRVLPSSDGWTDEKMIETVRIFARREQRAPTYQEAQQRQDLPNPSTLFERGMTWRQLLDRAGCPSTREWRRSQPWTFAEAVRVIREFVDREGRWPRKADLTTPLPAPMTVRNLFGTWSMIEVQRLVENAPPRRWGALICV